jgi:hypothetical protein
VVSFMAVHRVMQVNVVGSDAMPVGVLHATDIFNRVVPGNAT